MQGYAIAEISGHQFKIEEGGKLTVPRLEAEEGAKVTLDKILLVNNDGKVSVGAPFIDGAKAEAKVIEHSRGKKVLVYKKKRRKGYRKTANAREYNTIIEISKLSAK